MDDTTRVIDAGPKIETNSCTLSNRRISRNTGVSTVLLLLLDFLFLCFCDLDFLPLEEEEEVEEEEEEEEEDDDEEEEEDDEEVEFDSSTILHRLVSSRSSW